MLRFLIITSYCLLAKTSSHWLSAFFPFFSVFTFLQVTCVQGAWSRRRVRQFKFVPDISPEWFLQSWYTPKEHVFDHPITFPNLQKALSLTIRLILIQRWTALDETEPALKDSETRLINARFLKPILEQLWSVLVIWKPYFNSTDQR